MEVSPVVRYMLLCEDWRLDPPGSRRIVVLGLLSNIHALDEPPYPLLCPQLCVLLVLTEGRGQGDGQVVCVFEESGQRIFETPPRRIVFGPDPLDVVGVSFRIRDVRFPFGGLYSVQFWYNGKKVEERPLRLR